METKKGTIKFEYDEHPEPPWNNSDVHGPVRKSNNAHNAHNSDKKPSERPLNNATRNECQFYYDWKKAMKIAMTEWGFKTKSEAVTAVQNDFDFLRGWANNDWHYVFVTVEHEGETDSLRGVETFEKYHEECAKELLADLIARVEKEKQNVSYWNSRDICTIGA